MCETGHLSAIDELIGVRDSLNTIREANARLHLLTGALSTAASLASQIELFDVLLVEISSIRTGFAGDIQHTRVTPQVSYPVPEVAL